MKRTSTTLATLGVAVIGIVAVGATPAQAASPPAIIKITIVETFADDLILELCGVTTTTTLTERVTIHDYRTNRRGSTYSASTSQTTRGSRSSEPPPHRSPQRTARVG